MVSKKNVFCIIIRKRKSAPVRTHNLPDTPYTKIHPLHFSTQCHPYYCCKLQVFVLESAMKCAPYNFPIQKFVTTVRKPEYSPQSNSLNLVSSNVLNRIDQESDHIFFITGCFTKIYSKNSEKTPLPKCAFFVFKALSSLRPATKTCISLDAHFNEEFDKLNLISVN